MSLSDNAGENNIDLAGLRARNVEPRIRENIVRENIIAPNVDRNLLARSKSTREMIDLLKENGPTRSTIAKLKDYVEEKEILLEKTPQNEDNRKITKVIFFIIWGVILFTLWNGFSFWSNTFNRTPQLGYLGNFMLGMFALILIVVFALCKDKLI